MAAIFAQRYQVGELLGSGGFAQVFAGRDLETGRELAIKVIAREHASPELGERFRNEALALSRLSSSNVARVFDFGKDDSGSLYLVMELIRGVSLDVASLGRPLEEREIFVAARALFSALADAHRHGLVHRDVKPANVLVPGGIAGLASLKVLDFGIAIDERRSAVLAAVGSFDTKEGHLVGTPAYMAPEQITLGAVTPAADVYAAGLVLFELLGRGPLFDGAPAQRLAARISEDPVLAGRVPKALLPLLERALERDPSRRFADASAALLSLPADAADAFLATAEVAARAPRAARSIPSAPSSRHALAARGRTDDKRLSRLDDDPAVAFRQALFALDLPFLDALARRERAGEFGGIARATALALRLELAAAAALLRPLLATSPTARAIAATLVVPRGSTHVAAALGEIDDWVDAIEPCLGCLLASASVALGGAEHAQAAIVLTERLAERAHGEHEAEVARLVAKLSAGIVGAEPTDAAMTLAERGAREIEIESPLEDLVRATVHAILAFRADEHLARQRIEQAIEIASETGAALFEARALLSWGAVMLSASPSQALVGLARASTLLVGSDATSLEQMVEHNNGAARMILRRYAEAIPSLLRAIELAKDDGRDEYLLLTTANLAFARETQADDAVLAETIADLDRLLARVTAPRARAYGLVAKALSELLLGRDDDARDLTASARALAEEAGPIATDAWLLAEVLAAVLKAAAGEPLDVLARAGELEQIARERGFVSFFWFDVLREALLRVPDHERSARLVAVTERFMTLLGPAREG